MVGHGAGLDQGHASHAVAWHQMQDRWSLEVVQECKNIALLDLARVHQFPANMHLPDSDQLDHSCCNH